MINEDFSNRESRFFARPENLNTNQVMSAEEYLTVNKRMIFLYGVIAGPSFSQGDFGALSAADLILAFNEISKEPIYLVIDSPGGQVNTGFILYDIMKSIEAPIYTIGRSCQSMAAVLLAAGKPGNRYVYPHSKTMLHLPSGQISGDSCEIEIQQKEMNKIKNDLVEALIDCGVKNNKKKILKDIDREFWMSSEEVIKYGIADKIIQKEV